MKTIRSRLIVIGILVALSIWALVPRGQTVRVPDPDTGRMKDTSIVRVPIKYGLDLVGGIHLALEVDQSKGPVADPAEAIRRAERVVRTRIDEFGTTEPVVQIVGGERLVVQLPEERDPARAKSIVQRTAFLEFRITDMRNLFRDALPAIDRALRAAGVGGPAGAPAVGGVAQLFGGDSAAAGSDTAGTATPFSALLFQGSVPGEFLVPEEQVAQVDSLLRRPDVQRELPRGIDLMWGAQVESRGARPFRALYALENRPIITGEHLTKATAGRSPTTNQSEVQFALSRRGGRIFADATGRHVNDYMAIILDGRVQGQPPIIRSQIRGNGVIELGARPLEEANDLALVLRAGALPAPLTIVEERTIGPSLGADSIRDGVRASAMAVVFVVAVMLLYYRMSGALAVAAMGLYVLFALAGLALFGFTLTLPGLAGFALSIGMAVDANVLIFERMREELQRGKTVRLAVDEGFEHAMAAIVDSNVTTALTAFILYLVGTGPVQGFAVTLIIGIAASMITAVFVTRTLFLIWLQRRPAMTTLSI
ncbi:MAG TPA: protein translocase subunit SecD [Gemmatimonadales bacterium]|jgi:preprotein translocase subunit SecD|nr:protein translocase subunit SecD [Gemmatimonadales bacterium]